MLSRFSRSAAIFQWSEAASGAAGLILGFLLGRVLSVPGVKMDKEIDPIALAALVLSIILSILYFRRLERAKYADQIRKDTLIARLRDVLTAVQKLEELCDRNEFEYLEAARLIKRCNIEFGAYARMAAELSAHLEDNAVQIFQQKCKVVRDITTKGPVRSSRAASERPEMSGMVVLPADQSVEAERAIHDIRDYLYRIQVRTILEV